MNESLIRLAYKHRVTLYAQQCEKCNKPTHTMVIVGDRWAAWCGCGHEAIIYPDLEWFKQWVRATPGNLAHEGSKLKEIINYEDTYKANML